MDLAPDTPTFIVILDLTTRPHDRAAVLAQLASERPVVTAMAGCVAFRVYASMVRDTDVTVVHEWRDQDAFGAYVGSDAFARSNTVLRPLLTSPPISRRFHAELLERVD